MHGQIGICVHNLHKPLADGQNDPQLLHAFALERLLLRFAGFHLPADEFPQQAARLMRRPLTDQEPLALPDERRYYFGQPAFLRAPACLSPAGGPANRFFLSV